MGRPKLLLAFEDTTLAGALIRALLRAGVERVVVVLAPGADELRSRLGGATGVEIVENPRPERGMLSSVLCGLEALGGAAAIAAAQEPVLVTPADLPAIQPATIRRLIAAVRDSGASLVVPTHRGKRGHPLAIAPCVLLDVPGLDPAAGLHQLLDRHPVMRLVVEDPGVLADVDTPAEYERLRAAAELRTRPR